jgi:hypothetical protein
VSDRAAAVVGFVLVAALVAVFSSAAAIVGDHFQNEAARAAQAEEGR